MIIKLAFKKFQRVILNWFFFFGEV